MKIQCVQLYPLEVPMSRPIKMAGETLTHANTLLVRLWDEEGRAGWGEASSAPLMTGETLASIAASTEYLASRLVGRHIAGPEAIDPVFDSILYGNPSARSCLDTALLDLLAQRAAVPMHRLIGGPVPPAGPQRIEMLHMLASGDLQAEVEEARGLRSEGYRQWKIKVGAGDISSDRRRVEGLCRELEGDVVSADANQMLSFEGATVLARAGAAHGLSFIEQPFGAGRIDLMATLHRDTGVALCADESIHEERDIVEHHSAGAAQGASLKLIKLGGPRALLRAGRVCVAQGMEVNLACKVAETTVSAAATAHVGFALGKVAWGFSMSNRYLAGDVCEQPLVPIGGAVQASQLTAPGLGFVPQDERLRGFASRNLPVRELRA